MDIKGESKIVVKVDADIKHLVPEFLENRQKDIEVLKTAFQEKDYLTIKDIGHGMRGNGTSFGFVTITELGRCMENAADEKQDGIINEMIESLAQYLSHLEWYSED